jgi:hypothetical protein
MLLKAAVHCCGMKDRTEWARIVLKAKALQDL